MIRRLFAPNCRRPANATDKARERLKGVLSAGGPDAVRLAQALASHPGAIGRDVAAAARSVLTAEVSQPRPRVQRCGARPQPGANDGYLVDDEGCRLELRGYAVVYGALSTPSPESRGAREMLLPGAIQDCDLRKVMITREHRFAEPLPGVLDLAVAPDGVLFRLSNIPDVERMRAIVGEVRDGGLAQCSFAYRRFTGHFGDWKGEQVFFVTRVEGFFEVCVTPAGAFSKTAAWITGQRATPSSTRGRRLVWDLAAPHVRWIRSEYRHDDI